MCNDGNLSWMNFPLVLTLNSGVDACDVLLNCWEYGVQVRTLLWYCYESSNIVFTLVTRKWVLCTAETLLLLISVETG
jgi:hypothetical protein